MPRRSGPCTPSQMIRNKQLANIDRTERQNQCHKNSLGAGFAPPSFSTPIQSQGKKRSIFEELTGATTEPQNGLLDSARAPDKPDTPMNNRNTSTPINKTNGALTRTNQIDDSERTLVPDTQPANESVIPETQDDQIPETQDDQVPETQEDYIPETQESYTQEYAATDPVQAQVNHKTVELQHILLLSINKSSFFQNSNQYFFAGFT